MKHEATIQAMKNWCLDNYDKGADTMIECWSDSDYLELFTGHDGKPLTDRQAWATLKSVAAVYEDRQADALNSIMLEAIPSEEQRPTIGAIARQIRCDLFAERATIEDATANAYNLIHTLRPEDRIIALTALHVFANTIANAITTATEEPTA